ncbi:MAG: hypothetical protein MMC33_010269 [Icmadophila ericetorum]|nr:hypothetical protein [Icmadophila ericetorum]
MASPSLSNTNLVRTFLPTLHSHPSPATDPEKTTLPLDFSVLIIGASRGIGASTAIAYAQAGASTIILAARSTTQLEETQALVTDVSASIKVLASLCDVANSESVSSLATFVKGETNGNLDCIVLNAGYAGPGFVPNVTLGSPSDFRQILDINLLGCYHVAHYFIPLLLSSNGGKGVKQFFAVGSMAAWVTGGNLPHTAYSVSKYAQARVVEMVSEQFLEKGLLAVTVHPGGVRTRLIPEMPASVLPSTFRLPVLSPF